MARTNKKAQVHPSLNKAELNPQDYLEMAEQSDESYEAKKQLSSSEGEVESVEQYIDGTLIGAENAIRLLAKQLGVLAARPDPRTYLEQLAGTRIQPGDAEMEPDESQESEIDPLVKDPHDEEAIPVEHPKE